MRKLMTAFVAASLFVAPQAASAKLQPYADFNGWDIFLDDHDCTLVAEFGDSTFALDYDARKDQVSIRFEIPQVKSLKSGDTREVETYFIDKKTGYTDDGWGTSSFLFFVHDNETYGSRKFTGQFLTDLARYDTLAFFYKDTLLVSYSLTDSAKAVALLRQCADQRSRDNPSDPFV